MSAYYLHRAVKPIARSVARAFWARLYRAVAVGVQKDQDCVTFRFVLSVLEEISPVFQFRSPVGFHYHGFSVSHNDVRPVVPFQQDTANRIGNAATSPSPSTTGTMVVIL